MSSLFLCRLEHREGLFYSLCKHKGYFDSSSEAYHDGALVMGDNVALIVNMTISTSIFSPLILTVKFKKKYLFEDKIVPYHSVYGILLIDEDAGEACCLFTHFFNNYCLPFVPIKVEYRREGNQDYVVITLIERRALSLALTHSFACIGVCEYDNSIDDRSILTIGEIVEKLSTITEEEGSAGWGDYKNVFCFDAWLKPSKSHDLIGGANYKKSNCAVLSRFITPSSQSRLETIISLMSKYGYGFVYRMADRQYYAVDLLSNYAPGFYDSKIEECADGEYNDNFIFLDGVQSEEYFSKYGRNYLLENNINPKGLASFDKLAKADISDGHFYHHFNHSFEDFYINRLLANCTEKPAVIHCANKFGPRDYNYLSKITPLASSSHFASRKETLSNKEGFDLLVISRASYLSGETKREVKKVISAESCDLKNFMYQQSLYSELSGAQNIAYEDQVELNLGGFNQRENAIIFDGHKPQITTVNARIALAKYKLNHMKNNHMKQTFVFKNCKGLSFKFNIVYELLNWLGFHTDVFQKVAKCCGHFVVKRKSPCPSGSLYTCRAIFKPDAGEGLDEKLKSLFGNDQQFINNFNNYAKSPAIFGRLNIEIGAEYHNGSITSYSLTSTLTFFCDDTQCNVGTRYIPEIIDKNIKYNNFFTDSVDSKINEPFLLIPETATEFVNTDLKQEPIKASDNPVFDFPDFEDWALKKEKRKRKSFMSFDNRIVETINSQFFEKSNADLNNSQRRPKSLRKCLKKEKSSYYDFDEEDKKDNKESESRLHKELKPKASEGHSTSFLV